MENNKRKEWTIAEINDELTPSLLETILKIITEQEEGKRELPFSVETTRIPFTPVEDKITTCVQCKVPRAHGEVGIYLDDDNKIFWAYVENTLRKEKWEGIEAIKNDQDAVECLNNILMGLLPPLKTPDYAFKTPTTKETGQRR
jgi:hypothetical protein